VTYFAHSELGRSVCLGGTASRSRAGVSSATAEAFPGRLECLNLDQSNDVDSCHPRTSVHWTIGSDILPRRQLARDLLKRWGT